MRLYLTGDAGYTDAKGVITIKGRMEDAPSQKIYASPAHDLSQKDEQNEDLTQFIVSIIQTDMVLAEVLPSDRLLDIGADPMTLARLAAALQQDHGRALDIATMFDNPTIDELTQSLSLP